MIENDANEDNDANNDNDFKRLKTRVSIFERVDYSNFNIHFVLVLRYEVLHWGARIHLYLWLLASCDCHLLEFLFLRKKLLFLHFHITQLLFQYLLFLCLFLLLEALAGRHYVVF